MQANPTAQLAISRAETTGSEVPLQKGLSTKTDAESPKLKKGSQDEAQEQAQVFAKETDLETAKAEALPPGTVHMTPAELRKFKLEGIRVVIGGVLLHLVLGTCFIWGSVSLYVASWLREVQPDVDIGLVKMVFPLLNLAINITMTHGLQWGPKVGQRKWCCLGIVLIAICTFVSSWIRNFAGFLIVYGLLSGLANGLIYMTPVACGWRYFPNNKGAVSGWVIGGFGFGSFIFNYVALSLVNPDNKVPSVLSGGSKYFTADIYMEIPKMLRVLAGCYLVLGLAGALLIQMPKAVPANYQPLPPRNSSNQPASRKPQGVETVLQGVLSIPCLVLYLIAFGGTFYGMMILNSYKLYGLEQIPDDLFLTTVGSVGSAINGSFRIVWATISDKFGFKKVAIAVLVIQAVFSATYQLIAGNKGAFFFWYAVSMACEGGMLTLMPSITGRVFGAQKGSLIYTFVYFGISCANLAAFFISKYEQSKIGWSGMFWLSFGCTIFAILMILVFNENPTFSKRFAKKHSKTEEIKEQAKESGNGNQS